MNIVIKEISEISHYKLRSLKEFDDLPIMRNCPACNSSKKSCLYEISSSIQIQPDSKSLKKLICMTCGHGYYEKIPQAEILAEYYEKDWHEEINNEDVSVKVSPNYSTWAPINYLRDLNLPKEAKIMDFGCGYGDGIKTLELDGYKNVYGLEVGQARFNISSREFPGKVYKGSELRLPEIIEEHGRFDLIYSNHVFEHLSNPSSVLKYLKEALSPDGILIVSVPAPGSESAIHNALYFPHTHNYSEQSIQFLFESIGLKSRAWSRSNYQLAVVGSGEEKNLPYENFHEIDLSPKKAIATHMSIRNDLKKQIKCDDKNNRILTFCHPWTNFKYRKSGTQRDNLFLSLVVKSYDMFFRVAFNYLSKKTITSLKHIIRSVFYRTLLPLRISPSVDKLYYHSDSLSKANNESVIFCFDGDLKVLDK